MEEIKPLFEGNFFGLHLELFPSVVVQWVIICAVAIISILLTSRISKVPSKKQVVLESLVETINNLVKENMGEQYISFIPFVGTIAVYLTVMNLTGLIGVEPPTGDLSVSLGMGLISFVVIQAYAIYKIGLGHYFKGYLTPFPAILPLNIVERIMLPVSLSLRLFGNQFAGIVVLGLLYKALASLGSLAQIAIPVPLHFYFDLFDGTIQMIIFVMLTMINIKITTEH